MPLQPGYGCRSNRTLSPARKETQPATLRKTVLRRKLAPLVRQFSSGHANTVIRVALFIAPLAFRSERTSSHSIALKYAPSIVIGVPV
jgi:hypothetical protein